MHADRAGREGGGRLDESNQKGRGSRKGRRREINRVVVPLSCQSEAESHCSLRELSNRSRTVPICTGVRSGQRQAAVGWGAILRSCVHVSRTWRLE